MNLKYSIGDKVKIVNSYEVVDEIYIGCDASIVDIDELDYDFPYKISFEHDGETVELWWEERGIVAIEDSITKGCQDIYTTMEMLSKLQEDNTLRFRKANDKNKIVYWCDGRIDYEDKGNKKKGIFRLTKPNMDASWKIINQTKEVDIEEFVKQYQKGKNVHIVAEGGDGHSIRMDIDLIDNMKFYVKGE